MPWSKLKNIILLILVLTNLFLLVLVVGQSIQSSRLKGQIREETVRFLTDRGIQIEEAVIPEGMTLSPMAAERDIEGEQAAAAALLRGEVEAEARGGEVYRYQNENGSIQFHSDGTFSARLEPGAYPAGDDPERTCQVLLESVGFSGSLIQADGEGLTFLQKLDGVSLFGLQVTVLYENGSLTALTAGRRLVGEPQQDNTRQTISVSTAMVRFLNGVSALGDVCNRVDRIEQGYSCTASLSGPMSLTPVWRITTDTGAYQLDTVTGTVSRVE